MHLLYSGKRKSGIPLIGDLSWGTDFCQFYQTEEDLLEILVPYFRAGLESNEYCIWMTSEPLGAEDAMVALKQALPHFEEYVRKGQIEIIPQQKWAEWNENAGEAIVSKLDRAISGGFDGLRFACNDIPSTKEGNADTFTEAHVISRYNILAVFSYLRDEFDAVALMQAVKNHRFALVRNANQWELIKGSEVHIVKDALKRSEEKLHSLFSNMSEGFAYHRIVLDAEGKPCDYVFHEVNEAFEKLTGFQKENIIGKKVTEVVPGIESDPTDWIGKYGQVALTGKPVLFESYSEPLEKWYSISAFSPHKGFFAVTFNDITERKRAEQALRESEQRWAVTLSSIGDAVIATDTGGRVTFLNKVAEELTGWSMADAAGKPVTDVFRIVNELTRADVENPVYKVLKTGMIAGLANHTVLLRRGGGEIPIDDSGAPIRDKEGRVLGVVLVFRDISERKAAERRLEHENREIALVNRILRVFASASGDELFEQILDIVQEGLASQHGVFGYVAEAGHLICPSLSRMLDQCEIEGKCIHYPPEKWKGMWARALREKRSIYSNDPSPVPAGHPAIRNNLAAPIFFQGEVIGLLNLANKADAYTQTDRALLEAMAERIAPLLYAWIQKKLRQDERTRAEDELRQLNETLERRVAERTALAEARARQLQALAVELIESEEQERRRIARILHDDLQQLLASARLQLQAACQNLPPLPLLANVERLLVDSLSKSRSLSHELSPEVLHHSGLVPALQWLAGKMGEQFGLQVLLEADSARELDSGHLKVFLFRAAQELLFNVVKHAGVKSARVVLSEADDCITMAISDQGRGFDADLAKFSPATAGIGLLSLRERASAIGGSLWIESAPGLGSCFTLDVPLNLASAGQQQGRGQTAAPRKPGMQAGFTASAGESAIRLLFADDHKVMRQGLISMIAGQPDIQVVGEAGNGREAVELARHLKPDVVVMDVSMPEMDGVEATLRIKAELPGVRVIGLSMYEDEHIAQKMRRAGAESFVSKSASTGELLKAIYGITGP